MLHVLLVHTILVQTFNGLSFPYDIHCRPVRVQQQFRCSQFTIVLKAHWMRMGTGFVNDKQITNVRFCCQTVFGKPIIVFTQRAYNISVFCFNNCTVRSRIDDFIFSKFIFTGFLVAAYWRKLKKISCKHNLHSSKRLSWVSDVFEYLIDHI